jgi:hypothetical protein
MAEKQSELLLELDDNKRDVEKSCISWSINVLSVEEDIALSLMQIPIRTISNNIKYDRIFFIRKTENNLKYTLFFNYTTH